MLLTSLLNCPVECLKGRRGQWCGGGYCEQRTADLVLREHTCVSLTVSVTSAACVSVGLCSGSCRLRSRSQLGLCSRREALSSLGFLVPWGCGAEVPFRLPGVTWTTFSSSRLPSDPGLLHTPAYALSLLTQGEQASFQGSSEKTRPSWDNLPWLNSKPTALRTWGPSSHMKAPSHFVTEHNRPLCSHSGKRITQHIHQSSGVLGVISEFCPLYVLNCSWPGSGQEEAPPSSLTDFRRERGTMLCAT